jgi:RNA polymerase sigma factor (sigma-70 family)
MDFLEKFVPSLSQHTTTCRRIDSPQRENKNMSSTQVGTLLRFIRQLSAGWKDNELPDHQLLERFITLGDEDCFAALLRRHGPMVLRVCQSVLHNLHDAEDVFQAVFLVLARKAGSIHRREAVSSWLYGVAHRLAMKAQASAARRMNHEKKAAAMPSTEPLLDLSLRELQGIVHEELQRLPEAYRAPLVLCGLEEKSLEEAACLLGWSKGCVKGRLQRGREQLRLRLRRRGLDLSVGLLASALVMKAMSAPVSAALIASTLRAAMQFAADGKLATGVVSAKVAALLQGAMPTMFFSKLKILTLVVVAVGASVASLGAFTHREAAAQQEPASKESAKEAASRLSAAAEKMAKDMITVRGRVLDPEGKPLAGAKLYLGHYGSKDEVTITEKAKSDADGRFAFRISKAHLSKTHPDQAIGQVYGVFTLERFEPRPRDEADPYFTPVGQVMAVAEGFGCDWTRIDATMSSQELTLRLVKDVPISGRILDQDGKPVVGGRVYLSSVQAYASESLTAALAEFRKSNGFPGGEKRWGGPLPGPARTVTTGPDGRFRMAGLGGERFVWLHIEGPGIASKDIQVMTRVGDEVVGPDKLETKLLVGEKERKETISVKPEIVYGATFRYLAIASRPIRGVVTEKETGKPLAGVMIRIAPSSGSSMRPLSDEMLTTRTDQEGRYEVLGCPKSERYTIFAQPADSGLNHSILTERNDAPGVGQLTADIKLPRGIPIRGKVTDERTGRPIPGARVYCFRLHPNDSSRTLTDFKWVDSLAIAGPDGSFAVTALPGPAILGVVAPDSTPYSRSKAYREGELTDKALKDFGKKYKLPLDEVKKEQNKFIRISIVGLGWSIISPDNFNSLVLLHPDEKDQELKQDLKLRPTDREAKPKDEPNEVKKP